MALTQVLLLVDDQQVTSTQNLTEFSLEDNMVGCTFFLDATHNGGTTPTLDVVVQHSPDKVNWFTYDVFTQITTSDDTELVRPVITGEINEPLGFMRVRTVLGGTSPDYNLTVKMLYRLEGAH